MKFSIRRDSMQKPLALAKSACQTRTTMPVYTNVLMETTDQGLDLCGTDLEIAMRVSIRGLVVDRPGKAIVSPARLEGILRESPEGDVQIEATRDTIRVDTESANYEMPVIDPAEFSELPTFDLDGEYTELAAADVRRLIRRTDYAAARADGQYSRKGTLVSIEGNRVIMAATDGNRLAVDHHPAVHQGEVSDRSAILPPKAITLIERILSDGDDEQPVKIRLGTNMALFQTEKALISTRLLEGRFPPYQSIIDKWSKTAKSFDMPVKDFMTTVRCAAVMSDQLTDRVRLTFDDGQLVICAVGSVNGKSRTQMPTHYQGAAMEIDLTPHFLVEFLKAVAPQQETVALTLNGSNKPMVFRAGETMSYMIQPLDPQSK